MENKNKFISIDENLGYRLNYSNLSNIHKIHVSSNLSSIAILKNIVIKHKKSLVNLKTDQDLFMEIVSILDKVDFYEDKNRLTFYRIHGNNTTAFNTGFKDYHELIELPTLNYLLEIIERKNNKIAMLLLKQVCLFSTIDADIKLCVPKIKIICDVLKNLNIKFFFDKTSLKKFGFVILYLLGSKLPYRRLTQPYKR